jgi:hypothetical protein
MPDIPTGSQIFDLCFAPDADRVYAGLLNGKIKGYSYDEEGEHEELFTLRPANKSCRGLAISEDGAQLWAVGKTKSLLYVCSMVYGSVYSFLLLSTIDLRAQKLSDTRASAHE